MDGLSVLSVHSPLALVGQGVTATATVPLMLELETGAVLQASAVGEPAGFPLTQTERLVRPPPSSWPSNPRLWDPRSGPASRRLP